MDKELKSMFGALSRSYDDRERRERESERADREFNKLAKIAEEMAKGMQGFSDDEGDEWLSPLHRHEGDAYCFIAGFVYGKKAIKSVNPRSAGQSALEAFENGVAKRREMGV